MLPKLKKNFSLIASISAILICSVVGYYLSSFKKSPYAVTSLESFSLKWGFANELKNSYSSSTGDYTFVDRRDSLVKTHVKLRANELIFIHSKLNEMGFWTLPEQVGAAQSESTCYELELNYAESRKRLKVYTHDDRNPQQLDSAMRIISLVQKTIDEAESRYTRN